MLHQCQFIAGLPHISVGRQKSESAQCTVLVFLPRPTFEVRSVAPRWAKFQMILGSSGGGARQGIRCIVPRVVDTYNSRIHIALQLDIIIRPWRRRGNASSSRDPADQFGLVPEQQEARELGWPEDPASY